MITLPSVKAATDRLIDPNVSLGPTTRGFSDAARRQFHAAMISTQKWSICSYEEIITLLDLKDRIWGDPKD